MQLPNSIAVVFSGSLGQECRGPRRAIPEDWLRDERKFFRYVWLVHRDDPL